jgi:hypothetical protein
VLLTLLKKPCSAELFESARSALGCMRPGVNVDSTSPKSRCVCIVVPLHRACGGYCQSPAVVKGGSPALARQCQSQAASEAGDAAQHHRSGLVALALSLTKPSSQCTIQTVQICRIQCLCSGCRHPRLHQAQPSLFGSTRSVINLIKS